MFSELLKNNRNILQKTNSYLLPHLDKIIDKIAQVERSAGDDYTNAFQCQQLPKGAYLVKEGTVCRHLWFLEKGMARIYVCKKGLERNQYFFFPSEMIDSFCSSAFQMPSRLSIQLLEDSIVYSIPKSRLEELKKTYPLISDIEILMRDCHHNWMEERMHNLLFFNAREHYQYLLATQPYLIQHVSRYHLASFISISRETLCRTSHSTYEYARVG